MNFKLLPFICHSSRCIFISLLSILFVSCINSEKRNNNSATHQLKETSIEGKLVLSDTMPQPQVFSAGHIEKVKPGNPTVIPAMNNKIENVNSQKIEAGKPTLIPANDSVIKPPVITKAESRKVKAGFPDIIKARDEYSILKNPFSFSFYTRSQGLPHDDINVVIEDKQGKFWFGTFGGGLIGFNGTSFIHYNTENGLPGNDVNALFNDEDGNLWIGTRGQGIAKFDGKYFETYTDKEGLYGNFITFIFQDSKGSLWFGTHEGGITHFDGEYFTNYNEKQGLPDDPVSAAVEDNDKNIWFATNGGGIYRFDGQTFQNYNTYNGLSSNFVTDAAKDSDGSLWFGTSDNGISVFDGGHFYNINENTGLPTNHITKIHTGHKGIIWIGTLNKGIIKFDDKHLYNFKEPEGLINTHITDITDDAHNRIWFGTFGSGIGKYNGDIFQHFTEFEGLYDSFIRSITQDVNDNIWLASNRNGIFVYDKTSFLNYKTEQGLPSDRPRALMRDNNNNIWMGFHDGSLVKYDGKHYNIFSDMYKKDVFNSISTLWQDYKGNIWIGTINRGVFKYDGEKFTNYTTEQGIVDNNISKIHGDNKNIWMSSWYGGISKFDEKGVLNFTTTEGLPSNEILDIFVDKRGILWAGTNGKGVYYINNKNQFVHFDKSHGLGNNYVYTVFEDNNGGLLFGTRMGLSKMLYSDRTAFERRRKVNGSYAHKHGIFFKNYTKSDGFHGIGCNSRAIYQDKQNKIWIGANDILTRFNPMIDIHDTIPPNVNLVNIGLFNENIPWAEISDKQDTTLVLANGVKIKNFDFDDIGKWYGIPQNLKLAHNNNYIVFNYSGTNGRFQHMIRYQYMLDGLDANWSPFTRRTEAHYGNIPPGRYVFKLRVMNSETYMSDVLYFPITIKPPWWRSWWAYSLYTLAALLLLTFIYLYKKIENQKKDRRRREEWLLQQELEVARKSVEFKQNFLANMSHEIRTPLTGMIGMAEIMKKTPLNEQQKDYLQTMILSGENLRETINMVLDYSKIEAGQYSINQVSFSMKELLDEAEKYFYSICKKDLKFNKFIEPGVPEYVKTDRKKVFQIIANLISNASKYTNKGKVGLHISLDKTSQSKITKEGERCFIKVSVSDTGKGMTKGEQKHLFKPFYQAEQEFDRKHEGTGLGLTICKELTELLGGQIDLVSQKNQGTTFWFTFDAKISDASAASVKQKDKEPFDKPRKLNILFVEDKKVNQKVVKLMLESQGHKVSLSVNGKDALEKYTPYTYDLILMDIQMPVMDGITATKKLREMFNNLPPIVGLSANAFEGDREKYMNMGMDEYITKPVNEIDFIELLNKLNL